MYSYIGQAIAGKFCLFCPAVVSEFLSHIDDYNDIAYNILC